MYQNRSSETDSNWVSQRYQQIIPIELTDFKLQIQAKLVTFWLTHFQNLLTVIWIFSKRRISSSIQIFKLEKWHFKNFKRIDVAQKLKKRQ